ncbi:MAG: sulfite exporter TauE/SafE family protein [Lactococcus sp.]|nr:sulfite exporter TauE/SafE family protein [Lactococcus sp.]
MIGGLYFFVIVIANTIGAISGMGGGVLIKPTFDLIGAHSVVAISFYSSVAVLTMSLVSTARQISSHQQFNWRLITWVSAGAIAGGVFGNSTLDYLLEKFDSDASVQMIQIVLTIITLLFALCYSKMAHVGYQLTNSICYLICGLVLGFLASLLGIGGGPINVSLFMLLFSMPIKEATVYSICSILFSQLSKIGTIALGAGFSSYDLSVLAYIMPAAIIGGLLGGKLSHVLSEDRVMQVFQVVIISVLLINCYNGFNLL